MPHDIVIAMIICVFVITVCLTLLIICDINNEKYGLNEDNLKLDLEFVLNRITQIINNDKIFLNLQADNSIDMIVKTEVLQQDYALTTPSKIDNMCLTDTTKNIINLDHRIRIELSDLGYPIDKFQTIVKDENGYILMIIYGLNNISYYNFN